MIKHSLRWCGCVLLLIGLSACSTASRTQLADDFSANPLFSFVVEPAVDRSEFVAGFSDSEIDVATSMTMALNDVVRMDGISGVEDRNALRLCTTITEYVPGNAALRQFLPGIAGPTLLKTQTKVVDSSGQTVAQIDVSRSIRAGGAFTIGAWREVFDEVAREILIQIRSRLLDGRHPAEDA